MSRNHHTGFGFDAETARSDFATFTRWHDRRCLLPRPTMAECEATPSSDGLPTISEHAEAKLAALRA